MNDKPQIALFLHMYQPPYPVQVKFVFDRIVKNSYLPLTEALLDSQAKLTVNINASLVEMLHKHDKEGQKVLENIKYLAENNQIEFLESGAYHPLFPLISDDAIKKQIKLNQKINQNILGTKYNPKGVFPPELALDYRQIEIFSKLGYEYTLVSEFAFERINYDKLPYIITPSNKFFMIRRIRNLSNDLAFKAYSQVTDFEKAHNQFWQTNNQLPTVIGMDWETFGEHHQDYIQFLIQGLERFESITLSEYIKLMTKKNLVEVKNKDIRASSWSTDPGDMDLQIPFPLWNHPKNVLHNLILTLMDILENAILLLDKTDVPIDFYKSQQSCQLWWCARTGAPDLIKRASSFQVNTLKEIKNAVSTSESCMRSENRIAIERLLIIANNLNQRIMTLIDLN